jgi:hypothetical protein
MVRLSRHQRQRKLNELSDEPIARRPERNELAKHPPVELRLAYIAIRAAKHREQAQSRKFLSNEIRIKTGEERKSGHEDGRRGAEHVYETLRCTQSSRHAEANRPPDSAPRQRQPQSPLQGPAPPLPPASIIRPRVLGMGITVTATVASSAAVASVLATLPLTSGSCSPAMGRHKSCREVSLRHLWEPSASWSLSPCRLQTHCGHRYDGKPYQW